MKFPAFKELILFENKDIMVVNKPAFLASLSEREEDKLNLLKLAREYHPDSQICHRLDKETSGAIIIAKNPESYRFISMQFEHREIRKVYHAVIEGMHRFESLVVNLPILSLEKGIVKISRQEGKKAETIFNSIQHFRHYTLVECIPVTGRMHQIRIHLATQRASIAGDEQYGGKPVFLSQLKRKYKLGKEQEEQAVMKRFALHAKEVTFKLPDDISITINAPYPKDFATLLKLLEKFDS